MVHFLDALSSIPSVNNCLCELNTEMTDICEASIMIQAPVPFAKCDITKFIGRKLLVLEWGEYKYGDVRFYNYNEGQGSHGAAHPGTPKFSFLSVWDPLHYKF